MKGALQKKQGHENETLTLDTWALKLTGAGKHLEAGEKLSSPHLTFVGSSEDCRVCEGSPGLEAKALRPLQSWAVPWHRPALERVA